MKKIRIRLYRPHDYDLMTLYYSEGFQFNKTLRTILKSFINGKWYTIDIDENRKLKKEIPWRAEILLTLNEAKDSEIINFIENIKKGQRNGFLRNLLRRYLSDAILSSYLINKDIVNFVENKNHVSGFYTEQSMKQKDDKVKDKKPSNEIQKEQNIKIVVKKEQITEPLQQEETVTPVQQIKTEPVETIKEDNKTDDFNIFDAMDEMDDNN